MTNKFLISYEANHVDHEISLMAASPISALDQFHKLVQVAWGKKALPPYSYKITGLSIVYVDATKQVVYSKFDLPGGPNPDLAAKKPKPELDNEEFPWDKNHLTGKLSQ